MDISKLRLRLQAPVLALYTPQCGASTRKLATVGPRRHRIHPLQILQICASSDAVLGHIHRLVLNKALLRVRLRRSGKLQFKLPGLGFGTPPRALDARRTPLPPRLMDKLHLVMQDLHDTWLTISTHPSTGRISKTPALCR